MSQEGFNLTVLYLSVFIRDICGKVFCIISGNYLHLDLSDLVLYWIAIVSLFFALFALAPRLRKKFHGKGIRVIRYNSCNAAERALWAIKNSKLRYGI